MDKIDQISEAKFAPTDARAKTDSEVRDREVEAKQKDRLRKLTRDLLNNVDSEVEAEIKKSSGKKSSVEKEIEDELTSKSMRRFKDDIDAEDKMLSDRKSKDKQRESLTKMSAAELAEFQKTLAAANKQAEEDEDETKEEVEDFVSKTAKEIRDLEPEAKQKYYSNLFGSISGGRKFAGFASYVDLAKELVEKIPKLDLTGTIFTTRGAGVEFKALTAALGYFIHLYDKDYARPDIADELKNAEKEAQKESLDAKKSMEGENASLEREGKKAKYSKDYIDMETKNVYQKTLKKILKNEEALIKEVILHEYLRDFFAGENLYHFFMIAKPLMGFDSVSDEFDDPYEADMFLNATDLRKKIIKMYEQTKKAIAANSTLFDELYRGSKGGQHERRSESEVRRSLGKDVEKLKKQIDSLESDETAYFDFLELLQKILKNTDESITFADAINSRWNDVKVILDTSKDELKKIDRAVKLKNFMETFELDSKRTTLYLKALEAAVGDGDSGFDPKNAKAEFEKAISIVDSYATEMKMAKAKLKLIRNLIGSDMSDADVIRVDAAMKFLKGRVGEKKDGEFSNSIYSDTFMKLLQKSIGASSKVGDLRAKRDALRAKLVAAEMKESAETSKEDMITELAVIENPEAKEALGLLAKVIRAQKLSNQEELLGDLTALASLFSGKAGFKDADLVVGAIENLQDLADKSENTELKTMVGKVIGTVSKMVHEFTSAKEPKVVKESEETPISTFRSKAEYLL